MRKSPTRHKVKQHLRNRRHVSSYIRGKDKFKSTSRLNPDYIDLLKNKLLKIGGKKFQKEDFLRKEFSQKEAFFLIKRGKLKDGKSAKVIQMETHGCHENVIQLTRKNPSITGWLGLALSDDGIWRVHSWASDKKGRLIETTEPRIKYYGVPQRK